MSEHTDWCARMFDLIQEGGVWGVPRSGLIFTKLTNPPTLQLTDRMPHDPTMQLSAGELREMQNADLAQIREEFALAGITVTEGVSM